VAGRLRVTNGSRWKRTANTSNMCFDGIEGEALVIALDLRGFRRFRTGAARSAAPWLLRTSHRIGLPPERARARCFRWPRHHRRAGGRPWWSARGSVANLRKSPYMT